MPLLKRQPTVRYATPKAPPNITLCHSQSASQQYAMPLLKRQPTVRNATPKAPANSTQCPLLKRQPTVRYAHSCRLPSCNLTATLRSTTSVRTPAQTLQTVNTARCTNIQTTQSRTPGQTNVCCVRHSPSPSDLPPTAARPTGCYGNTTHTFHISLHCTALCRTVCETKHRLF
jgi:hypothetical protein